MRVKLGETPPSGKTTIEAWSTTWLAGLEVRPSTESAYRYALTRILPTLGGRSLARLRPSEIKGWRRAMGERLVPATVDATAAVLAMMLRAAVQDGLLERSPLPAARGGSSSRVVDPDELLTLEQVLAWGSALPAASREMPVVAATTGLRQGELLGLRLPQVDFLRRQVRVVEQLQTPAGAGRSTWGSPKTAAGCEPCRCRRRPRRRWPGTWIGSRPTPTSRCSGPPPVAGGAGRRSSTCGGVPGTRPACRGGRPGTDCVTSTRAR